MYNIVGYVSSVGLSDLHMQFKPQHLAFSPNPQLYNPDETKSDFELTVSHKEENGESVIPTLLAAEQTTLFEVIEWIFKESLGGQLTAVQSESQEAIAIAFDTVEGRTVTIGSMRADANGRLMPDWVNVVENNNVFRFYFNHASFEVEYTFTVNVVVPKVADQDIYPSSSLVMLTEALAPYSAARFEKISELMNDTPCTGVHTLTTPWVNPNNSDETMMVTFDLMYFGMQANTKLAAEAAVRAHLLKDTTHSMTVWEKTFPELFDISEFTIVPNWDNTVPGSTPTYYNPMFNLGKQEDLIRPLVEGATEEFVASHMQYLPTVYQSLPIAVCPTPSNSKKDLKVLYPDYILASSLDPDWIRMNGTTRAWVLQLLRALQAAEKFKSGDSLNNGLTAIIVDNHTYIEFAVAEIKCRVLVKSSYDAIINPA